MAGQRPPKATCKSCGEPITWALTASGAKMPVDVEPCEGGNVVLTINGPRVAAVVVSPGGREPGRKLHRSHFATCRAAGQHRKPVAARPDTPPAMPQEGLFSETAGR